MREEPAIDLVSWIEPKSMGSRRNSKFGVSLGLMGFWDFTVEEEEFHGGTCLKEDQKGIIVGERLRILGFCIKVLIIGYGSLPLVTVSLLRTRDGDGKVLGLGFSVLGLKMEITFSFFTPK